MPKKLTIREQRALVRALPTSRKMAVRAHCRACQQRGAGLGDILKSVCRVLGPFAKEIGPTVLRELVIPMLKKKMDGKGLKTPGQGLRLAGQRKPRRRKK